jgi:hypothetical protein
MEKYVIFKYCEQKDDRLTSFPILIIFIYYLKK